MKTKTINTITITNKQPLEIYVFDKDTKREIKRFRIIITNDARDYFNIGNDKNEIKEVRDFIVEDRYYEDGWDLVISAIDYEDVVLKDLSKSSLLNIKSVGMKKYNYN